MAESKKGWKTYTAAVGGMLVGLGMIAKSIASGYFIPSELLEGGLVLSGSLGLLGVGHKFQKLLEAWSEINPRPTP